MKTRKLLLFALLLAATNIQAQVWIWPIAGQKTGANILSQPNTHIDKELNESDLFIGGTEGNAVVCPVDGIIEDISIVFIPKLFSVYGPKYDKIDNWDKEIASFKCDFSFYDPKYTSGQLRVGLTDGRVIQLGGLYGKYSFHKGQKVKAGDTLGLLSYSYRGIKKPSLRFQVFNKKGYNIDPMGPFGLESTFNLEPIVREDPISVEHLREDLTIFEKVFVELYPSLNERMSKEAFHDSMEALRQSITKPTPHHSLEPMARLTYLIHDSHIAPLPDNLDNQVVRDIYWPKLYFVWCDDSIHVIRAAKGYEQYVGRTVKSIDGMPAHDYVHQAVKYTVKYDLNVQSMIDEQLILIQRVISFLHPDANADTKMHVVFHDGEEADIPFAKVPIHYEGADEQRFIAWRNINRNPDPDSVYTALMLNDSTAYLSIRSFEIPPKTLENMLQWIGNCRADNMIVDVRNNDGGDSKAMKSLLACFAQKPMNRQKGSHLFVNKRSGFEGLKYCENLRPEDTLFPNYIQVKGKPGFYCFDTAETTSCIMPDSAHQYKGRVYVLTNGRSLSCATIFPAVLVRNRRGVSVGRETGSAYHFINAYESAHIMLPNLMRVIAIPMVKVVFDTTVCARTPWGRGLLPDHNVPLTYRELIMGDDGETDVMLEYALQLIADGKYLSAEDPFAESDAPKHNKHLWIWIAAAIGAIALLAILIRSKRRMNNQQQNPTTLKPFNPKTL